MTQTFECPNCHASLDFEPQTRAVTVRCEFCKSTVIVPETLRVGGTGNYASDVPNTPTLDPTTQAARLAEVVQMVRSGRKIEAIKLFRETFHVGLKEAKDIVDQMERNEAVRVGMTSVQTFGSSSMSAGGYNPVLTDALGQPVSTGSSYGRTIGCFIVAIFLFIALVTIIPLVLGGGFAIWGVQEAGDIISTVESSFEVSGFSTTTSSESSSTTTSTNPANPTVPPASPTPGFAAIALQIGGQEGTGPGFFDDTRQIGVDAEGNMYAGDYQDGRIQVFNASGEFVTTWNAGDVYMISMAVDRAGVVYIPDTAGQLLRFEGLTGEALPPFTYGGRTIFRGVAAAVDGSIIAVAQDRIVRFDAEGTITLDIADPFNNPALEEAFLKIESVAVDGSGNLYFPGNNEIARFDNQGNFLNRFGSMGDAPDQFQGSINAIAVDGRGRIFVQSFKGVSVFESNGRFIDLIDTPGVAFDMVFNDTNQLIYMDRNGNQIVVYSLNQ
ncbi:MAG: hypothetical protein IPL78_19865 [Chloroflexi bacterium]|nr:hypothetical protein [Chloroflexota bacterium]